MISNNGILSTESEVSAPPIFALYKMHQNILSPNLGENW